MGWLIAHFSAVLIALVLFMAAGLLVQDRRTPQSTVAWLMAMVLIPYLAVPLFLALGARKYRHLFPRPNFVTQGGEEPMVRLFTSMGAAGVSGGNALALLDRPATAWTALIDLVRGAERAIDAEFYIVNNDAEGRAFVEELTLRAAAGVRVRLLIDRIGTLYPPRNELARLEAAGGFVRFFSPLWHRPDRIRLNLRNHRKSLIVDDKRAFTGGMNVGADYVRAVPGGKPAFDDLAMQIEGPVVADLGAAFRSDWAAAHEETAEPSAPAPAPVGSARVQLVAEGPDMDDDPLHLGLVSAIHRADRRVWVATPYFLPTEELLGALGTAARRGLDVRLITPRRSNHRIADFARGAYVRALARDGGQILAYQPGMLHAKAGMIDEVAWVGTANFDVRSMLLNFETAMFLYDSASVAQVEDWFAARLARCAPARLEARLPRKLAEGLFRIGAPLL